MLYFNYLFIKLLILYLYTTVNYCVEFTDFIRNLIRPQGHEKRRGSRREEVWVRETMFSQLAKRSPRVRWSAENCSTFPTVNIFRLFNSWVRASVPRVIAGTEICK